ncbi:MAG TPA: LuxR C-terminal-related transcriptional regulator [Stellaceae bacterium]|nr:LuxR C-terminal-related transcriptional regulator [Stellaceae bacterium]
MTTVALSIAEPELRARIEAALREIGLHIADNAVEPDTLARTMRESRADLALVDDIDALQFSSADGVPAILLIDDENGERAYDALAAGAVAVLARSSDAATLAAAIEAALRGLSTLPVDLLRHLVDGSGRGASAPPRETDGGGAPLLTPRELQVLAALADGASNKVIARRLGISFHTVKFHVAGILAKLGAETRTEAVAQGARLGLVML